MTRNPLWVPLSVAAAIAAHREDYAALSPHARRAAARADAQFMTPGQRRAVAERNADAYAAMRATVKATDALMRQAGSSGPRSAADGIPHACPRCGTEARGAGDGERTEWYARHYNDVHGGH